MALLDIKLPDMEGAKLPIKMHGDTPMITKSMITDYPSLENAIESLNLGADKFFWFLKWTKAGGHLVFILFYY